MDSFAYKMIKQLKSIRTPFDQNEKYNINSYIFFWNYFNLYLNINLKIYELFKCKSKNDDSKN